ncbi:MAG: hypothetical protein ACK518_00310 [bacterium]|jgi:hypothetical protein
MKTFSQFLSEEQQHSSAKTSLNQISAGIRYATKNGLIKPNSVNIDVGGGKFDLGKNHVEENVPKAKLHVFDPYNRSEEHNNSVIDEIQSRGGADYIGLHNVLNVIKEPEYRNNALETVKGMMRPGSVAHITCFEGDRTGKGRVTQGGSSWQEHRSIRSYVPEVEGVFSEPHFSIERKGVNILIRHSA